MITTRNLITSPNHLSTLLSLSSSSSSSLSSSSSIMQHNHDLNGYDLNSMFNALFSDVNNQEVGSNQVTPIFQSMNQDDLFEIAQQRRNSSFQTKQDDYEDLNENFNRKRFNSLGSNQDVISYGWPVNMQSSLLNENRRTGELINQKRDQRALSFNYDTNNTFYFDNNNRSVMTNQVMPMFQLNKQLKTNCLNPNCNLLNENLEFVKFICNSCQSTNGMHTLCFKKMQQVKRNSFNGQYLPGDSTEINYNCNNCLIGVLNLVSHQSPNQFKATSTPFLSEQLNDSHKFIPKTNSKLNKQSSPAAAAQTCATNSLRKKSLCLNNPPLPTPMQSVRESRSPSPITFNPGVNNNHGFNKMNKRQSAPVNINLSKNRFRTMSTGSTGSFSASSSFSSSVGTAFCVSPQNGNVFKKILNQTNNSQIQIKPDSPDHSNKSSSPNLSTSLNESLGEKLASSGNMFYSRDDWSILTHVPFSKQNAIHIRLEDEGPYGNDETRCFLLSHFSTLGIREIACVLCACHLNIYDRFPLIDGTFYVSPINYDSPNPDKTDIMYSVPAIISNKNQFIYAICLNCLHATTNQIKCKSCKQPWKGGSTLQIGTMYRYEIFAAFPCCQKRLNCSKCDSPIVNLNKTGGLQYFSSYSDEITCQVCRAKDYHFIKPLTKFYDINVK